MADNNNAATPAFNPLAGSAASSPSDAGQGSVALPMPAEIVETGSRDFLIGGAVLLVLMVAFFFAKNGYANMLVGRRVAPRSANSAGWWLFIFLSLISVAGVLAAVNRSVLVSPLVAAPLFLGAILALVLMLLAGRR